MQASKQLFTLISSDAQLKVSLNDVDVPEPKAHEVIVKIEAAPINPSDMWPMFGPASLDKAALNPEKTELTAPVYKPLLARVKPRIDQVLPIGNEGAGTVIAAGESDAAQAMLGKTVSVLTGATFTEYACIPIQACLVHHDSTTATQAASSFVNPLTALAMIETMHSEGHTALVHTAAASNLGQMLNKLCIEQDIEIVNIVRSEEQAQILRDLGAKIICNSSDDDFQMSLYQAIDKTGATLAFDAIGGGEIVSHILNVMEAVGSKDAKGLNTYGSMTNKQVYVYGGLDFSPTILNRAYGMTWSIGGWLMSYALAKLSKERLAELHKKVADEITTTFASQYTKSLNLEEVLLPENIAQYNAKKTGEKYLVTPFKD
ncbi:zinc-binding dehydrogenase [Thalassotalea sp. M1531]|uniref:Zinc-binding dehydrogenase n=1 Tax=Thalassotalea algicola TaxID=2716224 RepID=A0A7Y0LAU9_9GAMM|nr:zinc-binding dehydrogenase [Thalassotalea algicola]NMP31134.1 zinc-binding dehydrogenase [Thalassotalea algicola]